jgi:hypothetical protein
MLMKSLVRTELVDLRGEATLASNPAIPMKTLEKSCSRWVVTACLLGAPSVVAFPIAPVGTEGLPVIVSGDQPVIATYEGNSAAYSNDLYLALDGGGTPGLDGDDSNDLFIFNNHSSVVGSTFDLGVFPIGTELIFRLRVTDTAEDFFSGDASRNPDGLPHARVQGEYLPQTTLVSFEDLFGTPEYPGGYNDLSFTFENTQTVVVPEPSTIASVCGLALAIGITVARRRRS